MSDAETNTSNFKDERLNKRYKKLLGSFANSPNKSIPGTFKSWGETISAYRFFNNEAVEVDGILSPHMLATIERIKQEPIVLIPQIQKNRSLRNLLHCKPSLL